MTQSITHEHILLLTYGELPTELLAPTILAMDSNPELREYFDECQSMKAMLNEIREQPHPTTLAIISEHSHDSHIESV